MAIGQVGTASWYHTASTAFVSTITYCAKSGSLSNLPIGMPGEKGFASKLPSLVSTTHRSNSSAKPTFDSSKSAFSSSVGAPSADGGLERVVLSNRSTLTSNWKCTAFTIHLAFKGFITLNPQKHKISSSVAATISTGSPVDL